MVSAPGPSGGRFDALWAAAQGAAVPLLPTAELKGEPGLGAWRGAGAELCVMAFVTEILADEVLAAPSRGTVQFHPSLLPLHRGSSAINWAIINGDAETGLTVFWPDRGIDTGPVLLQKRCPIGPDDTVGSLYFGTLFPAGIEAIAESVALVEAGEAPRIEQDHAESTYEPPCGEPHAELRWHEPAQRIYALIRGCNPQPGAWTMFRGAKLRLFDSKLSTRREPGLPGRVLRISDEGVDIRLNGGVLQVMRVQPEGEKKLPAAEWAARVALKPGTRFR
jgi:methionyl-tRNA formyltransferase